ncbi:hypothetical protein B9479_001942 [Cryptococcus floricola]|uniref:COP9 signalosome complex subunit 2 n=1 Tax=Cryptococcus floricola TaxID=2591691 RepID=A0A5D3B2V8_9TREE|nr:hypothetical protein B9479_001942 [Cryptococcus floricola]
MSDDEFMMDDIADDEEYDFDYDDDDDDADDGDAGGDVENQYYKAKALKDDDSAGALKAFRTIVEDQPEKGEWGFKALKQMTKLNYLQLHQPDPALETYKELLGYTKNNVTRNYADKSINNILDYVGGEGKHALKAPKVPIDTLEKYYDVTRVACDEAKNERLSTKCNLKLAKLWLDRKEYTRLTPILNSLKATCTPSDVSSSDDQSKGSLLLEIYAIEIQMYSDLKENKKLKAIYHAASQVKNAIPHPRILGVIKECGGKMWMNEREFGRASEDLFESFKQYDESGSAQRIQVLKYLVLNTMLNASDINPFDSQEIKPYRNDPQIMALTNLVDAFNKRDVLAAEKILKTNAATITSDPFIASFIADLLSTLRTVYIIDISKPYTRLELDYLAEQLLISRGEVENLVMGAILDGKIKGKIDQVQGVLVLDRFGAAQRARYLAVRETAVKVRQLAGKVEVDKLGPKDGGARQWTGQMAPGLPAF